MSWNCKILRLFARSWRGDRLSLAHHHRVVGVDLSEDLLRLERIQTPSEFFHRCGVST
jgi:hypothetical protein